MKLVVKLSLISVCISLNTTDYFHHQYLITEAQIMLWTLNNCTL